MGVKSRRDKDELGRKLPQPGQRLGFQGLQVLGVAAAGRQRQVQGDPFTGTYPSSSRKPVPG